MLGEGPVASLRMRRALVAKYSEVAAGTFLVGRQLVAGGYADGVAPMEAIIEKEPSAFAAGAELLRDYDWRRNERELATHWPRRFVERCRRGCAPHSQTDSLKTLGHAWRA